MTSGAFNACRPRYAATAAAAGSSSIRVVEARGEVVEPVCGLLELPRKPFLRLPDGQRQVVAEAAWRRHCASALLTTPRSTRSASRQSRPTFVILLDAERAVVGGLDQRHHYLAVTLSELREGVPQVLEPLLVRLVGLRGSGGHRCTVPSRRPEESTLVTHHSSSSDLMRARWSSVSHGGHECGGRRTERRMLGRGRSRGADHHFDHHCGSSGGVRHCPKPLC